MHVHKLCFLLHFHTQLAVRSCLSNDSYPLNYTAAVYGREGSVTVSEPPLVLPSMKFEPLLTANARYLVTITVCNSLICRETAPLPICRDLKINRCFAFTFFHFCFVFVNCFVFQTQLLSRVQLWCSSMDLPTSHVHLPPIPLQLAASLYSLYQMEGKLSQFQELVVLSPIACASQLATQGELTAMY